MSTADRNDPGELARSITDLAERSQRVVQRFLEQQATGDAFQIPDPKVVGDAFARMTQAMLADPQKLVEAQMRWWQQMGEVWQAQLRKAGGEEVPPVAEAEPGDRRFKDEAWSEDAVFDYIKQSYLVTSRWVRDTVSGVEGLDPKTREKVDFYTRQFTDALAPTNFIALNPAVLREAAETKGESLLRGLRHLLDDLERGSGRLKIKMTDEEAFEVGVNLATTPGKVVYQNELFQLVQYAASTEKVHRRPLLITPPWINKFYILDLKPRNSFIKWAVDQGFTVFVVSWVNPDESLGRLTFEDYMTRGQLQAIEAVAAQTGERELTLIGYCLGGTLTACLLAWMAARGDDRVKAVTFLTCMLDFSEPGELGVFIDDEQLRLIEEHMEGKGYLEAKHMQQVFSLMRSNDLVWSFVVNNYLLGREPMAFDLLYWNGDSTRMPRMMHSFYLRNMYQRNLLVQPGGIELAGVPIDLGQIKTPAYFLSTREDHIAPWRATYAGSRLLGGPVRFVLGGSGHIAGVVNPASSTKYGYWTGTQRKAKAEDWLAAATQHEGSWWPDWRDWLVKKSGPMVPARDPSAGPLPVLDEAPGSFVRTRAVD